MEPDPGESNPNRAILLTPPGAAAIAVVRLVGPKAAPFLRRHFSPEARAGRCIHGVLADGARIIDDPVVVTLPEGNGADLSVHGGTWVVRSVLELAAAGGFEIVEFAHGIPPLDAVEGTTLLEREVAANLPLARTELALRALLEQPAAWERFDRGARTPEEARQILADKSLWHLLHPPSVAIVGAANVGKSTLANQLFGQERSITADLPGTTRDWVGEIANVNGLAVLLVDTPGLRVTDDSIEQEAIARSRARIDESELVVLVLDATRPVAPEQETLLRMYPKAIRVMNKCDEAPACNEPEFAHLKTVATTGEGVDALRRAICGYFRCADLDLRKPRWWTPRLREVLENSAGHGH